jgi:putative Mg2+ transporter-C (MgtC) family protein
VTGLDVGLQLDLGVRMLLAAVLGAAIGFEREIHEHPAGMRTHLLVSLGSGIFTVLSIVAFSGPPAPNGSLPTDTSRVAAQIVSGIGFLGAGAILKYGTSVRGLTTAASLWATAAVGMACGAGEWLIAAIGTAIVIFSLWPLNVVVNRIRGDGPRPIRVRLHATKLDALGEVTRAMAGRRVEIGEINTQRLGKGSYEIELQLRPPASVSQQDLLGLIGKIAEVEVLESDAGSD